ncbi:hypothetical protein J6590_029645 [Homalodisca vitripennis]|nr:hypothetical protein J6590_029645 [Homalodisca vitripennis]
MVTHKANKTIFANAHGGTGTIIELAKFPVRMSVRSPEITWTERHRQMKNLRCRDDMKVSQEPLELEPTAWNGDSSVQCCCVRTRSPVYQYQIRRGRLVGGVKVWGWRGTLCNTISDHPACVLSNSRSSQFYVHYINTRCTLTTALSHGELVHT